MEDMKYSIRDVDLAAEVDKKSYFFEPQERIWRINGREELREEVKYRNTYYNWTAEKHIVEKISKNENAEKLL